MWDDWTKKLPPRAIPENIPTLKGDSGGDKSHGCARVQIKFIQQKQLQVIFFRQV